MKPLVLLASCGLAGLPAVAYSQTYTTHFAGTEHPLSEGGAWKHEGLDWATFRKARGIAWGTQTGTNTGASRYDDSYAHLSGFPPDQEAWGEAYIAKPNPGCHQEIEILLRWTSSAHRTTGYECFARCLNDDASYVQIVRWDGPLGKFTYLADKRGRDYGLKHGDVLKASVVGNVITVYINGVEKARAVDDTFKTGNPGIGHFLACDGGQGIGSNADFGFSSFTARGIAAATMELSVTERQDVQRRGEPVTFGVPLPKGALRSAEQARLVRDGVEVPAQFRATGLWYPDRSVRWLLVDFQTDIEAGSRQNYVLEYGDGVSSRAKPPAALRIEETENAFSVDTGVASFRIGKRVFDLFQEVRLADGTAMVTPPDPVNPRPAAVVRGLEPMVTRAIPSPSNKGRSHLIYAKCAPQAGLEDYTLRFTASRRYEVTGARSGPAGSGAYQADFTSKDALVSIPADAWLAYAYPEEGDVYTFSTIPDGYSTERADVSEAIVLERGPLRSVIRLKGSLGRAGAPVLEFTAWYHFYAGSGRVKLAFTLENDNHGGRTSDGNARNADIGGINCVFFDAMALRLPLELGRSGRASLGGDVGSQPIVAPLGTGAEIYQDSSGGERWDLYRDPKLHPRPNSYVTFPGYGTFIGGAEAARGRRALGWLDVSDRARGLVVAVEDFWQNYPKALSVGEDRTIEIGLFPGRFAAHFPLRSGEHKTHEVLFLFRAGAESGEATNAIALGFDDPLRLESSPRWIAGTRALGDLHPFDIENYRDYEVRNLSAIGVFPQGVPRGPSLLSRRDEHEFHGWMDYGDVPIDFEAPSGQWGMKYDLDYRMAQQYGRTLDPRWWRLFVAADRHTRDIDIHHQPHYPGLHFVRGGVWAHSLHSEPGDKNPHRNYNHFTKDLCYGARGTAALYYLTGDWKAHDACLEIAENALAQYMSPQEDPGEPLRNNRMGVRGDGATLNRLLEGYLLSGDEKYLDRARWQVKSCAFDGRPPKHEAISLWSSLFYMEALARYVELFPEDGAARVYLLAHLETLRKAADPRDGILYTITPQPDGAVAGDGTCSHYNVMAADLLAIAHRLTGRKGFLDTARACFAYGVKNANGVGGSPTYFQVHSANGAMHGNVFMAVDSSSKERREAERREASAPGEGSPAAWLEAPDRSAEWKAGRSLSLPLLLVAVGGKASLADVLVGLRQELTRKQE